MDPHSNTKELGICAAWIGGILLIGGMLWFFTQPLRVKTLQDTVNARLIALGRAPALEAAVPRSELPKGGFPLGIWYTQGGSQTRVLVFALISGGIPMPCVALVSDKVDALIPLIPQGEQTLKRLPQGILAAYIQRIEGEASRFLKEKP